MVKLRLQKVSDAKKFFNILKNPNFKYFDVNPASINDEIKWLEQNEQKQKDNLEWNYTIINDNKIVGAIGVKINYHRKYIGEVGYFIDESYWNKGIASKAVKLLEDICFKELKLSRLEILIQPENKASVKVAVKNNYIKEGLIHKVIIDKNDEMRDCYLYAKVF